MHKVNFQTGVYCITNILNGNRYIGSAAYSFYYRFKHHLNALKRQKHANRYLQNAWNKYGADNFKFTILEEVPSNDCLTREQFYIETLKPEYNLCSKARSSLGIKRSEETKLKLSKAKLGANNPMFGKNGSLNKSSKPIICVSINAVFPPQEFETISDCARFLGMKMTTLSMILRGRNSDKSLKKRGITVEHKHCDCPVR